MAKQLIHVGDVDFGHSVDKSVNAAGWRSSMNIMGRERVKLLTKAMNGEELPDGLFLVGHTCTGWKRITKDDVNWSTHTHYLEKHKNGA